VRILFTPRVDVDLKAQIASLNEVRFVGAGLAPPGFRLDRGDSRNKIAWT
jgi:hypothetical protein